MIEITDLNYSIDSKIIFENANVNIAPNKYVLEGNNGVGKTTLFNILDKEINVSNRKIEMPKNYLYINQFPLLLENTSVKNNIKFFNSANSNNLIKNIQKHGIGVNKRVSSLSGGQKQLLYLLLCLYTDFDLYLIDEPFNNLDTSKVELIKELIDKKEFVVVIDHSNKFEFEKIKIKNRRIIL